MYLPIKRNNTTTYLSKSGMFKRKFSPTKLESFPTNWLKDTNLMVMVEIDSNVIDAESMKDKTGK